MDSGAGVLEMVQICTSKLWRKINHTDQHGRSEDPVLSGNAQWLHHRESTKTEETSPRLGAQLATRRFKGILLTLQAERKLRSFDVFTTFQLLWTSFLGLVVMHARGDGVSER